MPMGEMMNSKQLQKKIYKTTAAKKRKDNPAEHKKNHHKSQWKCNDIVIDDFDKTYDEWYIKSQHCEYCDKWYKNNKDRQLDHDHKINFRHNVRGVLCQSCNFQDVFDGYFDCLGKEYYL